VVNASPSGSVCIICSRTRGEFADQAAQPGAGAQDHGVAAVQLAPVVPDRAPDDLADLAPAEEGVAAGGGEVRLQRTLRHPRFDLRVLGAPQPAQQLPAQRRVVLAHRVGVQQLPAAHSGVGAGGGLGRDRVLRLGPGHGQRAAGPEADLGDLLGDLAPQFAGPQRGRQLGPLGPAADPHQPEVAHRRSSRLCLAFQMDDLMSALDQMPCMHGPERACSYDDDSHGVDHGASG
jgi:hypothetical protein